MSAMADSLGSRLASRSRTLVGAGHVTGVDLATPLAAASQRVEELRALARRTSRVAAAFRRVGLGVGAPPPVDLPRWITGFGGGTGATASSHSPEFRYAANRVAVQVLLDSGLVEDPGQEDWLRSLLEPSPLGGPRQIWSFALPGPTPWGGDEGRIVEVWGDLAGAEHVAVLVPGMGTTARNFESRVATRARNLLGAANALGSGPVAVVGWFDYDAPDDAPSTEVLSDARARDGAARLGRFLGRIPSAGDHHVTLIGHSYGSVVVGATMLGAMAPVVDDVLVMGSPGTGVDSTGEFGAPGTGFYTMEAPVDPVPDLDWFGTNPNELESGFRRVETGPRPGHSSYLGEGTEGLDNAALIVTGRGEEATVRGRSAADWIEEAGLRMERVRHLLRENLPESVVPGGFDDEVLDRIATGMAAGDTIDGFIEETVTDALRATGDLARLAELVSGSFPGVTIPDPPPLPDWSVFRIPVLVPVVPPLTGVREFVFGD